MAGLVNGFATWLSNNSIAVLIGSFVVFSAIALYYLIAISRLRRTVERYRRLLAIIGEHRIEQLLLDQVETVRAAKETVDSFQERLATLERGLHSHLQKVGLIRYNAFSDVGSDLSFSLALLDHHDNGIVISCIHGRDEARTYAKPVARGRSSYALSHEELLAIQKAVTMSGLEDLEGKCIPKSE